MKNVVGKIGLILIIGILVTASAGIGSASALKTPRNVSIASPATASVVSPIFVAYVEDALDSDGVGTYTIATGASHPHPNENVLYGGADGYPWSSYNTIRVNGSMKEYVETTRGISPSPGYTIDRLDNYVTQFPTVVGNSIITRWTTPENLNITQTVETVGTTLSDSSVRVTTQIRNDNSSAQQVDVRYVWDLKINDSDDTLFKPRNPDGTFTNVFSAFTPPTFGYYEVTANSTDPPFSVFGSISQPAFLSPQPTTPDSFGYVSWGNAFWSAYDFTPGGCCKDSAVVYYWDPTIQPGDSISLTAYITTEEKAITGDPKTVPAMAPIGIAALAGLLGLLAVVAIRRRL